MGPVQQQREMQRLIAAENAYLRRNGMGGGGLWQASLQKHVPETLEQTLRSAFAGAFSVILRRGTSLIEKTCQPEKLAASVQKRRCEEAIHLDGTTALRRAAERSSQVNLFISGVGGVGLGLLGLGLPDIPVLLSILLRGMYETALHYGFPYDTEEEQIFILQVMEAALLHGEDLREHNAAINYRIFRGTASDTSLQEQIRRTSDALAAELLYLKFLQGIPVVGVVGGVSDMVYQRKIAVYAELKYRRRYILRQSRT